jgi:hypothetical protein
VGFLFNSLSTSLIQMNEIGNTDQAHAHVYIDVNSPTCSASARVAGGVMLYRSRESPCAHYIYGHM